MYVGDYYYNMFSRVGYILNVTREIDNFYPEVFKYLNIRFVLCVCVCYV